MGVNNMARPGATGIIISPATLEEWTVETGGGLAESNAANSIVINVVPKEGGNTFRGTFSGLYANDSLQANNLTDQLRARGLTTVNKVKYVFNTDGALGGPIKKDKLWFFTAHRLTGNENVNAGLFFNATQGSPFYTPDPNRPAFRHDLLESHAVRLTWQASAKNKINMYVEPQKNCVCRARGSVFQLQTHTSRLVSGDLDLSGHEPAAVRSRSGADALSLAGHAAARDRDGDQHDRSVDRPSLWLRRWSRVVPAQSVRIPQNRRPVHRAVFDVVRHGFACVQNRIQPGARDQL